MTTRTDPHRGPPLSVAMSVYNGEPYLSEAIESILGQSFIDFEFLIIDDGSSDDSASILRDYAARDSRIRLILRENRGLIASLNELVEEARAPLIARMDADDIALPARFERQIAFLEDNPDYGVVGCLTINIDEHGDILAPSGPDHPLDHEAFLRSFAAGGPSLCHPAVMMRRDLVLDVGGYHAAFKHCEDLDLWLRLASITKLGNVAERLIKYRHYEGQVSDRHATDQAIGAVVSRFAYAERNGGRTDPTAELKALPPLGKFDSLFARSGIDDKIRKEVARAVLYSRASLTDHGFDILVQQIAEGGAPEGAWRTVGRLVSFGEFARAARLATALFKHGGGSR